MGKKKKKTVARRKTTKTPPPPPISTGPSFSVDAVVFMGALLYNVRKAIEREAIERSEVKKNIPLKTVEDVARSLNLTSFMEKV